MTSPTSRPVRHRPVLHNLTETLETTRDEIELGWSALLDELRDAGWPGRTPEGDRRPSHDRDPNHTPDDPTTIDYHDPTGNLALTLNRLQTDRETLEEHRECIETSLRALHLIANRHRPKPTPTIPACSINGCTEPVESTHRNGKVVYRGVKQIHGIWIAKDGMKPLCTKHRNRRGQAA